MADKRGTCKFIYAWADQKGLINQLLIHWSLSDVFQYLHNLCEDGKNQGIAQKNEQWKLNMRNKNNLIWNNQILLYFIIYFFLITIRSHENKNKMNSARIAFLVISNDNSSFILHKLRIRGKYSLKNGKSDLLINRKMVFIIVS